MKRKLLFGFIGLMLFCVTGLDAQMTKPQLQAMYTSYLREQGYQPEVDSDGDVVFKAEGRTFWIDVDDTDLQSFRIVYSNFWEIESLPEKEKVYEVANYINRTTKVAKVYVNSREDDVSMDANIFIENPEDFKTHFRRMIDLLLFEIREFRDKMNE
ncbi:MAG: YbjN domain-containing protein [Treponema sp.]|nr:YbjN domain-containing protein [Treponema sp.]